MKIKSINLVPLAFAVLLIGGCGTYGKVLKSGDRELMYHEAQRLYGLGKYYKVITLADEMLPRYHGSEREDSVAYLAAASNYKLGHFNSSSVLLDDFRRRFPRSVFVEDVEFMYAKGYYHLSPEPNRDPTSTYAALATIKEYLARYPNSVKKEELEGDIVDLQNRLYDKSFINAKVYYNIGSYKSASVALRSALDLYPETPHREELLYLTVKSDYLLALNSIDELQRDRYLNTMDSYYTFASEYPQSKHIKELDKLMEQAKKYVADTNTDAIDVRAAAEPATK